MSLFSTYIDGKVYKFLRGDNADIDLANLTGATSVEVTIPVPGAKVGDPVWVTVHGRINAANGATESTIGYNARVSAADTVTVHFANQSAGAVNVQDNLTATAIVLTSVP